MNARLLFGLMIFGAGPLALAADAPKGYDAFRVVRTRNIFNPDRLAPRPDNAPSAPQQTRIRSASLTLTGTMVTDTKALAFFSGSGGGASNVVPVGGTIADFKVTAITAENVSLEKAGTPTVLAVGKQLALASTATAGPDSAEAAPSEEAAPAAADGAPAAAPAAAAGAAPASSSSPSDVLRRMMERRQKEMSK